MVRETMDAPLRNELHQILRPPVYLECFMRRVPLMPIHPNHRTQLLFIVFFACVVIGQFLLVFPL